jgi:hypothetical protein
MPELLFYLDSTPSGYTQYVNDVLQRAVEYWFVDRERAADPTLKRALTATQSHLNTTTSRLGSAAGSSREL